MEDLEIKIAHSVTPIVSQIERQEEMDDPHLLRFQLKKAVESIEASVSSSNNHLVEARVLVLRGGVHRYMQESSLAEIAYRKALCLSRGTERRAFQGLYLLTAQQRPLLSLIYLVKSGMNYEDIFTTIVGRLARCPSELRDVPPAARAAVISILSGESTGRVSQLLPSTSAASSDWDTLCVILLIELFNRNPKNDRVEELIKLLVGRACSFDLPLTILAAVDFEPARRGLERYRTAMSSEVPVVGSLEIDHLIGVYDLTLPNLSGTNPEQIARSRLHELGIGRDRPTLCPVIVDAANVAYKAAEGEGTEPDEAACWALKEVEEFFVRRGHEVIIVVSDKHLIFRSTREGRKKLDMRKAIAELKKTSSPLTTIIRVPAQNHDDSYMIATAIRHGGVVVTNDMFRDWKEIQEGIDAGRGRLAEKWTKSRLIAYVFTKRRLEPNPDFRMPSANQAGSDEYSSLLY